MTDFTLDQVQLIQDNIDHRLEVALEGGNTLPQAYRYAVSFDFYSFIRANYAPKVEVHNETLNIEGTIGDYCFRAVLGDETDIDYFASYDDMLADNQLFPGDIADIQVYDNIIYKLNYEKPQA